MTTNRDMKQIGDVQDRGKLKWTALMLPEHVRMLRDWMDEDNRIQRPELDEFDLQTLQENIEIALMRRCEVEIQVWVEFQFYYYVGKIISIDVRKRSVIYDDSLSTKRLQLDEITSVRLMD
ncbi:YolD-like family protein [Planococcus dechangensis]|uniref:YolD-like family protein n=2 Tax=Planococcus dechangensis TaxID=1176255 RepID=A0ABV9MAP8_9BACL